MGTWENLGETRGWVGKSGMLEHKSDNIYETRKARGKVTGGPIGTYQVLYQRSFEQYYPRPPTASSSPDLKFATPPKTSIAIISGTAHKSPLKILEKRERGCIQGLPKVFKYPYYHVSNG